MAFLLVLLLVGSCGQLALAANITKLPKETLEWWVCQPGGHAGVFVCVCICISLHVCVCVVRV